MNFMRWDLGNQDTGAVARVVLEGNAAYVRLMDSSNFRSYQRGERCQFSGGYYDRSPVVIRVPHYGHWYLVIDYGGGQGRGKASVQMLANA